MTGSVNQSHDFDIVETLNKISEEVNYVLNSNEKSKYFECVIVLFSLVENLIKWLIFVNILWTKSKEEIEMSQKEIRQLIRFCEDLSFKNASLMALSFNIIDFSLHKKIDKLRKDRNMLIHRCWEDKDMRHYAKLRKRLERLAEVSNELIGIFNKLTEEIGVDEVYNIQL